ncbi:hypothetical protein TVAG_428790 [Trichomonas vaginalis G3]|uniref:Uncharacterized protein n=1 Tax=Trichomonas vaginalis (strain ATCC PRA-98 / G3) TaxID=412133 RepID=A2FJ69_TRIV3|nr:uncharacterized protein TVAGG3_1085240 [Trichomonas vaginalis G3]XP_051087062.1 hypothetical protein TVAGG3_0624260 [Trichomonas vaginalis G3]XP_051098085.1 hypothetical protein TVAGG3_0261870 [Trichomonas vaginalis G3]XP_051099416.1 hypothetical protein TVAGG3_0306760 [Trichomonas vaginalis G3]XP_051101209.1 hypothetical protein TVAGG3_0362620 [Trichomonas vaginalis G3]XP_051104643.1 hypothetical protein TVAGG3_0001350 [Trichomonas vaginalis G3]EAX65071.1 hypothetical protein TVAG_581370 |eukprot:XP_001278001.1 hypothetical protein [Trichomonas vaginalis G3]
MSSPVSKFTYTATGKLSCFFVSSLYLKTLKFFNNIVLPAGILLTCLISIAFSPPTYSTQCLGYS